VTFTRNLGTTIYNLYQPGADVDAFGSYVLGDAFTMPSNPYGMWRIDSITLFSVVSTPTRDNLASEFSSVWLFTGDDTNGVSPVLNGNFMTGGIDTGSGGSNGNSLAGVTHTYTGQDYTQDPGTFPIWATTFTSLNWVVPAGVVEYVGMWGAGTTGNPGGPGTLNWGKWYNLYRDPVPPDSFTDSLGADGFYEKFSGYVADWGAGPYDHTTYTGYGDLNMIITAEAVVPEPGTFSLLVLGGVALMALRRRVRASAL
jgi:hypothetical protein